jgi:hypothetical protein
LNLLSSAILDFPTQHAWWCIQTWVIVHNDEMFDVYWSDQHQTVAESQDQAPVQNKEGARQRPSSRPSFFKQLSGKLQDGGQKTKRSSSALSIRSSNKSTQGLSIASNDGHLPAQELPAYSHEPHELPATEKRAATSLLESPTLEYNKADGQPHSPSTGRFVHRIIGVEY